jgi:hypothetical protein
MSVETPSIGEPFLTFLIPEKVALALKSPRAQHYSEDHCKVAYLVSLFGRSAESATDRESWIRQHPLWVFLYEGIVAGAIEDPDYAPASVLVSQDGTSYRVWMNISQEGKALVDELREHTLLNGLKLSSSGGQPITCFQISDIGKEFLAQVPQATKDSVDAFVYGPADSARVPANLLSVQFDQESREFSLVTANGFARVSEITETEDVSYVSSAYIPKCLRQTDKPTRSNAHRRHESGGTATGLAAEQSAVITLGQVSAMVVEWVPFGANQIVALNERLGALDRCQGGFFTSEIDTDPTSAQLDVPSGLTSVNILDYDFVRFTNFSAEIGYAVDEGIVQVEDFGMHISIDGSLMYGMFIEAIMDDDAACLKVDDLARVLVDVHQDSSEIMNDILSNFQRKLLDMMFMGDMANRGKFNVLVTETIDPLLDGNKYMDRSERELEIKQIIGDLLVAKRIGDADLVLLGREGLVYSGERAKVSEELVVQFAFLLAKEQFIRNFFVRMFILTSEIASIGALIRNYEKDPNRIFEIRERLNKGSQDIIMLEQTLGYLLDSLNTPYCEVDLATAAPEVIELAEAVNLADQTAAIMLRANDMRKLVKGAGNKLSIQRQQSGSITQKLVANTVNSIDANYASLVSAAAADERSAVANDIMNLIFAGSFAFGVIDRLTGDDILGGEGVDCGDMSVHWIYGMLSWLITDIPGGWFALNIAFLFAFGVGMTKFMGTLLAQAMDAYGHRQRLNLPLKDPVALASFINTKTLIASDIVQDPGSTRYTVKVAWEETDRELWRGEPPKITLEYDPGIGFLLQANLQWNGQRQKAQRRRLVRLFLGTMESCGAVEPLREDQLKELGLDGVGGGGGSRKGGENGDVDGKQEGKSAKSAYVVPASKEA